MQKIEAGELAQVRRSGAWRAVLRQAAGFGCGAAACGGLLFGVAAPFGLALALGLGENEYLAAAAGAAVGALMLRRDAAALAMLCALAAAVIARRLRPRALLPGMLAACGTLAGLTVLLALWGAARPDEAAAAVCEGGLAAAFAWLLRRRPPEGGGPGLLAPGMMLAAVLTNLAAGLFLPGVVFCAGCGLVLACRGRKEQAAVGIVALCTALCAAGPGLPYAAVGVCGGTVLAAVAAPGRRLRCGVLFALGCLPGALCVGQVRQALSFALAVALAELVFALLPQKLVLAMPAADPAETAGRPAVSAAAARLSAVAESLSGIAETVNGVYAALPRPGETYNWVVERTQEELCGTCARREECWQRGYNDSVNGMFALKAKLEQNGRVELEELPAVFSRCIHPSALCGAVGRAWGQYTARRKARVQAQTLRAALTEQYDAVADALTGLAAQLATPGLPEPYKSGRVAALFSGLGMEPLECAVTQDAAGRMQAAVTVPRVGILEAEGAALAGEVGRLCHRPMESPQRFAARGATTLLFAEKPVFQPVFALAAAPAQGRVSGDAVQQFCTGGAAVMLLCDGMGTGRPAAVDGNLAAELTARLLRAGFAPDTAARLINVALALKSDEESGATLDLLQVDLFTGGARLYKAGAAPGFLVQGGKARLIGGPGLPVGILSQVRGQLRALRLAAGDWVVMASDGLFADGPEWVAQQLELCAASGDSPQAVAELLVKTARMRAANHGRPDDITAAVLRLEKYG